MAIRVLLSGVAATATLAVAAAPALAGDGGSVEAGLAHAEWHAHPGAAVAAVVAMVAGGFLAAAGLGCAIALVGAVVPRLRDAIESAGRDASAGRTWLVGCLALGGALLAITAAAKTGVEAIGVAAAVAIGLPTIALVFLGALGAIPLLGERLLGAGGATASPLRRCVTATVALALAIVPAFVPAFVALAFVVGLVGLGWPLGVGIEAARRALRRRAR